MSALYCGGVPAFHFTHNHWLLVPWISWRVNSKRTRPSRKYQSCTVHSPWKKTFSLRYLTRSDLQNINSENPAQRADLAQVVKDACMRVGFFYGRSYSSKQWSLTVIFLRSQESWDTWNSHRQHPRSRKGFFRFTTRDKDDRQSQSICLNRKI